jgi:tetratricopeptide (TPR) repeat protein
MPASVYHGDDGETITDLYTLGIQHPPGYPLHTILGRLFTLIPLGDVSYRVYLFSSFVSLLNFLLVYLFFLRISPLAGIKSHPRLMSAAAGVIFSLGFTVWEQSIIAKGGIYIFNLFFTLLLSHIILHLYKAPVKKIKYLYLFSFVYALSLGHHHMSQEIVLPLYAMFLYKTGALKKLTLKNIMFISLFFLAGIAVYLYLPLRADTAFLNWGQPSSFDSFFKMVTRWQYLRSELTRSFAGSLSQVWKFMTSVSTEYSAAGVLFLIPGLTAMYRRDRNIFIFLTGIALFFLGITAVYLNLTVDRLFIMETYITPVYFPLSIFIAVGIYHTCAWLREKLGTNPAFMMALFSGGLIVSQAWYAAPRLDKSSYFIAYDYNRNMFDSLEQNSMIFVTGDGVVFPSWYLKYAKRYRPDITLVGSAVLPMKWVRDSIKRQDPSVSVPRLASENIGTESTGYIINALIKMNFSRIPVYFSYNKPEDNALGEDLKLVPRGIIQKVLPTAYAQASPQYIIMQENMWKFYNLRGLFDRHPRFPDTRAIDLYIKDYSVSLNSAGTYFEDNGLNDLSLKYFTEAHYFYPKDHEYIYNMGNAHFNLNDIKGAIELYKQCLAIEPMYESGWFNLAVSNYKLNNYKEALEAFRKVKEINPKRTDIDPFIDITQKLVQ